MNKGYRSWGEQYDLRKRFVKDKSKREDEDFLCNAASTEFSPVVAKPGWSNHHDGGAYDFDTVDDKTGKFRPSYAWLIKNAIRFGFVRTVPSETWHWEHRPGVAQYAIVPQDHPSWKTNDATA
jgi:LAS superfamily LD-carboxypeptidase LdcB